MLPLCKASSASFPMPSVRRYCEEVPVGDENEAKLGKRGDSCKRGDFVRITKELTLEPAPNGTHKNSDYSTYLCAHTYFLL